MASKVDQSPAVNISTSSTLSASSPKISMFAKKSGFVIPKNKLSGSLVPIFRGVGKVETGDLSKEDTKQVQRKTKWGIDLTQDASVRRGRALAYQTRVEQITKQLKSGVQKIEEYQGSQSPSQSVNQDSYIKQIKNEPQDLDHLELERREAIGEMLRLNPNYKAPPDYKPLLKEAKVPVPLKAYPKYNFISVLLGPGSNTQKRLEEETGAKIQVFGAKADTGEKREITQLDKEETQGAYEEVYVLISADTFEKVDAAVGLIELLVAPVSGNPTVTGSSTGPGDDVNLSDQIQDSSPRYMMPMTTGNQGLMQPTGPTQSGSLQVHFQPYPGPWVPLRPQQAPGTSYGFAPPNSLPVLSNNSYFMPPPVNPYNSPFFRGRPPVSAPINPTLVSSRPQLPMQVFQPPSHQLVQPQNLRMSSPHPPHPAQSYPIFSNWPSSAVPQFSAPHPSQVAPTPVARVSAPSMSQPASTAPSGSPTAANTAGWTGTPPTTIFRSPNIVHLGPNSVSPQRPHLTSPQSNMPPNLVSRPLTTNFIPPSTQMANRPVGPGFSPVPPRVGPNLSSVLPSPPISVPAMTSSTSVAPIPRPVFPQATTINTPPHVLSQAPKQNSIIVVSSQPIMARAPVPTVSRPLGSVSGSLLSFSPMQQALTSTATIQPIQAPKPLGPSSGDFTFQPQNPQLPASQTPRRPNNQPLVQSVHQVTPQSMIQPSVPQAPNFQLTSSNQVQRPSGVTSFQRPQAGIPTGQPQAPAPPPRSGSAIILQPPPSLPEYRISPTLSLQMGSPRFLSAPQGINLPSPLPIRPGNFPPTNRPGSTMLQNQHSGKSFAYPAPKLASNPSGGNQIYDPFSPTSISPANPQQGDNLARR